MAVANCSDCMGDKYERKHKVCFGSVFLVPLIFYGAFRLLQWGWSVLVKSYTPSAVFSYFVGTLLVVRLFVFMVRKVHWQEWANS